MADPNLFILEEAAAKLGPLLDQVVFVGGAILGLLINDSGAPPIRATIDVDVIAEISTTIEYYDFSEKLKMRGFTEDDRPQAPTCRWRHGDLILDVMPVERAALGFTNRWYRDALKYAVETVLPTGRTIKVIAAPYFLGTKFEAFRGRGSRDFYSSPDLEDFIAVIDGRLSALEEIQSCRTDLRLYLAEAARELLTQPRFIDALPGYMLPDQLSQRRLMALIATLEEIAKS